MMRRAASRVPQRHAKRARTRSRECVAAAIHIGAILSPDARF